MLLAAVVFCEMVVHALFNIVCFVRLVLCDQQRRLPLRRAALALVVLGDLLVR